MSIVSSAIIGAKNETELFSNNSTTYIALHVCVHKSSDITGITKSKKSVMRNSCRSITNKFGTFIGGIKANPPWSSKQ